MYNWILIVCIAFVATLSAESKVLAFAGSARKDSLNKKLVVEAADLARQAGATVTLIDLKNYPMPIYNGDLEETEGMPGQAKELRQLMIQNAIILISSPEHNGSVSALLKNTIDWASRDPKGGFSREAFQGKKFVLMSASPGSLGGARGLVHLKMILEALGGTVVSPQTALPDAYNAFDAQGHLKSGKIKKELEMSVQAALEIKTRPPL